MANEAKAAAGRRAVASVSLWCFLVSTPGCCMTAASASEPDVPRLKRPSDEVRVRYCAEVEQAERERDARERHRHTALLGLGLSLGTVALATAAAAGHTKGSDEADALKAVAITTGVTGGVSFVVGGVDWAFNVAHKHDENAAVAARSALDIVTLSDVEEPEGPVKDDAHEKAARKAFDACVGVEGATKSP
jgi:hypothetical protein